MATQIGTDSLIWGTTDQTWGYVENLSVKESHNKTFQKDGAGEVVAVEFSEEHNTVSGSYVYRTSGGPLAQIGSGTSIDLSSQDDMGRDTELATVYIDTATTAVSVDNFMKVDFEGEYYPNLA